MEDRIEELRARIAEVDRSLLDALNARLALVAELRAVKASHGLDFVDPEQEQRVVDALVKTNDGPLTEAGVRELVEAVLALTKRELDRAG
jgi:3-deoxy-7-phosphoheptulonate synthase / chorismate mutase